MNEKIKELALQAQKVVGYTDGGYTEIKALDQEKLAELIVEECARICDVVRENNGGDKQFGARLCADEIRYLNRRS
jgi:hypothetical protein